MSRCRIFFVFCAGSINRGVGHALADRHNAASRAGRTSRCRQRRRLRRTVHRLGVGRPHDQGLVHVDMRVRADPERTQARHRVPPVPRQARRFRQLGQHDPVSYHISVTVDILLNRLRAHFAAVLMTLYRMHTSARAADAAENVTIIRMTGNTHPMLSMSVSPPKSSEAK